MVAVLIVTGFYILSAADAHTGFNDRISIQFDSDILWRTVLDTRHEKGMIFLLMPNGIQVYDGGVDFVNPSLVSQLKLDGRYDRLELFAGNGAAYSSDGRIVFVDVSDPYEMKMRGNVDVNDTIFDYVMYNGIGFAACGFDGVKIIGQSDVKNPAVTSDLQDAVHAVAVDAEGGHLYVADDYNGLLVYDLSDPLAPQLIDFILFSTVVRDISVTGDKLYIATGDMGVDAYRVELPWRIVPLRTDTVGSQVSKVKSFDEAVLAVDLYGAIHVFSARSSEERIVISSDESSDRFDFARLGGRDYVLTPDRSGDFRVLSVDNESERGQVWLYPGSNSISNVALLDSLLLVSDQSDDLGMWKIGDGTPKKVSSLESSNQLTYVTALDSLVFVAENSLAAGFLHLLSTAGDCCELDFEKTMMSVSDIADIKAEYNDTGSIDIVSFGNDGTTIMTIGFPEDSLNDFYVAANYASILSGFRIAAAERAGEYVYTITSKGSIGTIYDASMITFGEPVPEIGGFSIRGGVRSIEVLDNVCYAAGSFGLRVFEMDGPLIGRLIDNFCSSYGFHDLVIDEENNLMFAALGGDGIAVFDITDRATPELLSITDTPGFATQLDVDDDFIAVADEHSAQIFRYELYDSNRNRVIPKNYILSQNYPNPFNSITKITVSIPNTESTGEQARLEIFNPLGQIVRTIVDRPLEPGKHVFTWDARGYQGETVASGVYFYRFSTTGFTETRKMLYLK